MRCKSLLLITGIALTLFLVSAIPEITVNTPSSSPFYTLNNSIELNFSISENNLGNLIYNWNGTNYSFYDNSLIAMYNLDNNSALGENSTYVADNSKYSNNGTIIGATWNANGKYGGAYQFDGVNDYINISDSSNFDFGTGAFSISMWFKKIGEGRGDIFNWKKGNGEQDDFGFILQDDETFEVFFRIDGSGDLIVTNGKVFSINQWHQAVFVRNNSGNIVTYIDGSPDGSGSSNGNINNIDAGTPIWIGSNKADGAPANSFNGSIDEVRIWNRSLSNQEIYQNYISNLQKFNQTQWYLYANQSKNTTSGLSNGTYTYQLFAANSSGDLNSTEQRTVKINELYPKINIDWIYPTTNINVTQNKFFNVSINLSCLNSDCGAVNVSLDPVTSWWNSSWNYRMPIYFNETMNLARTFEHIRINVTFAENKLKNENHTALVCNGTQVPFEGYALTTSNGWVTSLQGLTELSFNAYENKSCYLYYDNTDTNVENTNFLQTGWHYTCDNAYSSCGTPEDITTSTADYFGNYSIVNDSNINCNGDIDSFSSNIWCYFKAPSSGTVTFATASDDGSNLYVEDSKTVNNAACQGTTCLSGSTTMTKDRYYSIEVDYDENDGGNTLYAAYSPTTCSSSSLIGNYIDTECYGYYGDEWKMNISSGSEEIYSKGLIPTTSGTIPFYTTTTNPYSVTLNAGQSQVISWDINATGNSNRTYAFFVFANLSSNLSVTNITSTWNITITESPDTTYPVFSEYGDNNGTLNNSGTGLFNVTLLNTNGTVLLEINNTNITATNHTENIYNVSYAFTSNGTFSYKWHSWGNGSNNNYNVSETRGYTVNYLDTVYPIFSNYSDNNGTLNNSGIANFNITILNANGTVWLLINNSNYTASNSSLNSYNVSINLTSAGVYNYTWNSYGNGTDNLFNNSEIKYYTVNSYQAQEQTQIVQTAQSSGGGSVGDYILEQNTKKEELKIRTWISPNKTVITKIKQDKSTGIKEIELKAKNWLSGEIFVVAYNETPNFCSIGYTDKHKVYRVLDFNNTLKNDSIDSGRLKIGIQKDWIYKNNISEIKFVRCYPEYKEVKSSYGEETDKEGIYNVYINGFSAYAILGTLETPALNNTPEDKEKIWNTPNKSSGLGRLLTIILVMFIAIGLILLLVKHRIYLKEKIHNKFFDFEFKFRLGK